MNDTIKVCAIIPVFRHGKPLARVAARVLEKGLALIVVDDGNDEETKADIRALIVERPEIELVELPENRGKGGAVVAGFFRALDLGFTHAFQIDADGQHDLEAIPAFVERARVRPNALIAGAPQFDASAPSSRRNGRKITNQWTAIETLSTELDDAMCGFRLYPLDSTCELARAHRLASRMTFDIDILVRLYWRGVPIEFHSIRVTYPVDGFSNFRMLRDNIEISALHTRLFFGMLLRAPLLIARKAAARGR